MMFSGGGNNLRLLFKTIAEDKPGIRWQRHFHEFWPDYKRWFLSEGERSRPRYLTCQKKLKEYLPELHPIWEELTNLAGGGDLEARFLSLYNPPPFLTGCSQTLWLGNPPALIRNYDYSPTKFEAVILKTNWLQPVIAVSDCLWGVVDGINGAGLAVSLAFGGSNQTGIGFGIPLILRYVLECCTTVQEAVEAIGKLPAHMSYNISLLDSNLDFATVFVSPDEKPRVSRQLNTTNHQEIISWQAYADLTHTIDRKVILDQTLENYHLALSDLVKIYLNPPIYSTQYARGFGTLYTSIYYPYSRSAEYLWPGFHFGLDFYQQTEPQIYINYL